jgi:5-methylcytosine-specific restriction protein A
MLQGKRSNMYSRRRGALRCEACNFDFQQFYGDYGQGFAECHHKMHLQHLNKEVKTTLEDLEIVCANCHRMLHKIRPWITARELHDSLVSRGIL